MPFVSGLAKFDSNCDLTGTERELALGTTDGLAMARGGFGGMDGLEMLKVDPEVEGPILGNTVFGLSLGYVVGSAFGSL